jgi:hypothetical protein
VCYYSVHGLCELSGGILVGMYLDCQGLPIGWWIAEADWILPRVCLRVSFYNMYVPMARQSD